jgi:hypothetical protein
VTDLDAKSLGGVKLVPGKGGKVAGPILADGDEASQPGYFGIKVPPKPPRIDLLDGAKVAGPILVDGDEVSQPGYFGIKVPPKPPRIDPLEKPAVKLP